MKSSNLTEGQRALLVLSLRIAGDQFGRDARVAGSLSDQFLRQEAEALELADRIEAAVSIHVEGD